MEETKMEETKMATVKRVQIYGVPYFKDHREFLYKEKKKKINGNSVGDLVGVFVNINGKPAVLKKRVNLVYTSKSNKIIEICTSLDTLDDLVSLYEGANKKAIGLLYQTSLKIIREVELIEYPTVDQAYNLIRAVRSVIVTTSVLTNQPIQVSCITCSYCKEVDIDSTFKKCGDCKKVYFCSSECNKRAWSEHKMYCKEIMCREEWL